MPFDEIETITRDNMPPEATVSYETFRRSGKPTKRETKPRLVVTIPTTLCGTAKSKTFRLLVGSGDDEGKLLIRGDAIRAASAKPGVKATEHAHFFRFNFGFVPRLGEEDTFEGQKCPVAKISDEEFVVTVPKSWFNGASQ